MKKCQIRYYLLPTFLFVSWTAVFAYVPSPKHVVIVIEENHNYSEIIGSSAAPYINNLADSMGALFTESSALTHPSQPNHLMLFSGSNQGVTDDNLPAGLPFTAANLGASLIKSGKTFVGYSEDMPSVGYTGTTSGAYARKHNPWVNWQNGTTNGIPSTSNLPFTSFPADFDSLPTVSFVMPTCNNDMHNGTNPATITTGDTWLQNHLNAYIQWTKTNNSLFILTYDEGTQTGNNKIVTLFVGSMVKPGRYNETINHYSVLRTIEDMFGLPYAGESSSAMAIADCWTAATRIGDRIKVIPMAAMPDRYYTNPFNPLPWIGYNLPGKSQVTLSVCNALGRQVAFYRK
jgi:phosphatidylinositol-3-phosphatase